MEKLLIRGSENGFLKRRNVKNNTEYALSDVIQSLTDRSKYSNDKEAQQLVDAITDKINEHIDEWLNSTVPELKARRTAYQDLLKEQ